MQINSIFEAFLPQRTYMLFECSKSFLISNAPRQENTHPHLFVFAQLITTRPSNYSHCTGLPQIFMPFSKNFSNFPLHQFLTCSTGFLSNTSSCSNQILFWSYHASHKCRPQILFLNYPMLYKLQTDWQLENLPLQNQIPQISKNFSKEQVNVLKFLIRKTYTEYQ